MSTTETHDHKRTARSSVCKVDGIFPHFISKCAARGVRVFETRAYISGIPSFGKWPGCRRHGDDAQHWFCLERSVSLCFEISKVATVFCVLNLKPDKASRAVYRVMSTHLMLGTSGWWIAGEGIGSVYQ